MEPGLYYHVYNRGVSWVKVFRTAENSSYFMRKWKKYMLPHADVVAYCLMPTHFHFLVWVKQNSESEAPPITQAEKKGSVFPYAFGLCLMSYAKAFNKRYHRHGPLFQSKFKRKLIRSTRQLEVTIAYIHANPIVEGHCNTYEDWEFSSYHEYKRQQYDIVNPELTWQFFGGLPDFKKFHEDYLVKRRK